MQGKNFYINFETLQGTLLRVAEICWTDPTCVSFDYTADSSPQFGTGWLHRISHHCAQAAGGVFLNGTSPQTSFYELKQNYRRDNFTGTCQLTFSEPEHEYSATEIAGSVSATVAVGSHRQFIGVESWPEKEGDEKNEGMLGRERK